MSILFVDLMEQVIEERPEGELSGYLSMKEFLESAGPGEAVAFSGFSSDVPDIRGASTLLYAFRSPLAGKNVYGHANSHLGLALKSRGYSALFIKGRARRLSYIALRGSAFEVRACEKFRGSSFDEFASVVRDDDEEIVFATGRAADVLAPFAAAYINGREIGRGGFGAALSLLNLKGIVFGAVEPERNESEENRKYMRRLQNSRFASFLKRESNEGLLKILEKHGCLPIEGFTRRRDARAIFLDGRYLKEKYGVYNRSCTDCPVSCHRLMTDNSSCPDLFDAMSLGTMLGIFSSDRVMALRREVNDAGIERYSAAALFIALGADTPEKMSKVLREVCEEKKHFDIRFMDVGGLTPALDPRGSGEAAIYAMTGITDMPFWSLYAPERVTDPSVSAVLALYERLYVLALSDRGLPVTGAYCAYISQLPAAAYRNAPFLRLFMQTRKMFGIKASVLLKEGWKISEALGEERYALPDRFIYSVDRIDPSVAEPVKLMDAWNREKALLERKLFKEKKVGKGKNADPSVL